MLLLRLLLLFFVSVSTESKFVIAKSLCSTLSQDVAPILTGRCLVASGTFCQEASSPGIRQSSSVLPKEGNWQNLDLKMTIADCQEKIRSTENINDREVWIGLNDISDERGSDRQGWSRADGSFANLNKWRPNEPNNINNEDCVRMYTDTDTDHGWLDAQCSKYSQYACSRTSCPGNSMNLRCDRSLHCSSDSTHYG